MQIAAGLVVGQAPTVAVAAIRMFFAGDSWLAVSNGISLSAQLSLSEGPRARSMALFMMAAMAGNVSEEALFGAIADCTGERGSMLIASLVGAILHWNLRTWPLMDHRQDENPR